jgi:hypothetical protein
MCAQQGWDCDSQAESLAEGNNKHKGNTKTKKPELGSGKSRENLTGKEKFT